MSENGQLTIWDNPEILCVCRNNANRFSGYSKHCLAHILQNPVKVYKIYLLLFVLPNCLVSNLSDSGGKGSFLMFLIISTTSDFHIYLCILYSLAATCQPPQYITAQSLGSFLWHSSLYLYHLALMITFFALWYN